MDIESKETRTEAERVLIYLELISDDIRAIKGWMTFIGILIIVGLVVQLFRSCMVGL